MEKQDIISSGLLELHVVGIASEKEAKDVEEGLLQYPEVAAELKVINDSMEAYANAYSITPAAGIKEKILAAKRANIKEKAINEKSKNPDKDYCHISISDNGIGFDAEYETRIFEVFRRLHSNIEFQGTGIGLAIVKKIVENHEGTITAKGTKGKGAQFDIYIPEL